jgi:hypothetical protein
MTIDRLIPTSGADVTGTEFAEAIQDEVTALWGNAIIPLTDAGGTGDAITASVSPALTDGLQTGMNFWLDAAADNTGAATIAIGDEDAVDLVDDDGLALGAALLKDGRRYLLAFDGSAMRVYGSAGQKRVADYQAFTESGTWNKPAGTPDGAIVIVEAWGGGGGGGTSGTCGGGGGGEYKRVVLRGADVSASETVTVAEAAAAGVAGGNSSFGTHVTAYGGGKGANLDNGTIGGGGAGGGPFDKGGNGSSGGTGGSAGPSAGTGGGANGAVGDGYYGGGGGGAGARASTGNPPGYDGGRSVYGGGGGGGSGQSGTPSGGNSSYGGNGGNDGANGSPPGGGGGGAGGAGARGEVRVRTVG